MITTNNQQLELELPTKPVHRPQPPRVRRLPGARWWFSQMMAVHTSNVEPLPHQITAVYESMLPRQPLRFVLADDPGAGKTIMAGLYTRPALTPPPLRHRAALSAGFQHTATAPQAGQTAPPAGRCVHPPNGSKRLAGQWWGRASGFKTGWKRAAKP